MDLVRLLRSLEEFLYELVGWLAFLGLLLPVIGFVLIGVYPVAER